jgi:hypothetical protein
MEIIPLSNTLPNQRQTVTLDQNQFIIVLRTIGCLTYASITLNGEDVIDGICCQSNQPILPYEYLENDSGNFAFYTPNDEYPYYEQFGVTHNLVYASAAELAALRGN